MTFLSFSRACTRGGARERWGDGLKFRWTAGVYVSSQCASKVMLIIGGAQGERSEGIRFHFLQHNLSRQTGQKTGQTSSLLPSKMVL